MQVINWLELQPSPADLDALRERLQTAQSLRNLCKLLVETTLRAYPWGGRPDLISCYHPSQFYKQGQRIALLIADPHNVHPTVWQLGQVKQAKMVANPVQGRFQIVTVEIRGKQVQMAGSLPDASYPEPNLSRYTAKDLAWLVEWISTTYAASLQAVIKKLIERRQICGQLVGETFLPDQVSAISPELLYPLFAGLSSTRPWINLDEIYQGLPDLSHFPRETVLAQLFTSLKESPYQSLGAGRWTTLALFKQLDREVPLVLPTSSIGPNTSIWTKREEKNLAGYESKFVPTEARHALEELGFVEKLPEPDESPWRPPKAPVQLPALHYLHITQAYFPVGNVLCVFPPGLRMVFVQFINGEPQPFLLDREHGLLKAVHPEELCARFLREDIPAGVHLWLEYEGDEKYRITPRALPFKRMVPCKLAYLEDRRLHIAHTHISMKYEGNPALFKTNMSFEEIEALFAEASRLELSVPDALIYAIQELCATDPDHRAHRLDIINAVVLQRRCSPGSVSLLLYTQPCFEQLGGGYFRYRPTPREPAKKKLKRKDRLSKLWDNLLADAVAPNPKAEERTTFAVRAQESYPVFPSVLPNREPPSPLRELEVGSELSVPALSVVPLEEDTVRQPLLRDEKHTEMLVLRHDEAAFFPSMGAAEPESQPWRTSFDSLLHSLEELENNELSGEEVTAEVAASFDESMEAVHEESLSFSSPFRWDPKPAWIDPPSEPKHTVPEAAAERRLVYIPKIPRRPLHKKPLYQRIFYYLRRWLSSLMRKTA